MSRPPMIPSVFTMVGPGDVEAGRLRTLLASLFRHEPALPLLVIVDDSGGDAVATVRPLVPASCRVEWLTNPSPPSFLNLAANTLIALRHLAREEDVRWTLKLDTDALVIGPFVDRIDRIFRATPTLGQVGRGDRLCDGTPTDFGPHATLARRYLSRLQVWRSPRFGVAHAFTGVRARYRHASQAARQNGLKVGEHCQGGAYAVSREALRRLDAAGHLDDAELGTLIGIAEDLMTTTLIASTGLAIGSHAGRGDVFGVEARGLPMRPAELVDSGYAIIHSIKKDTEPEAALVTFFENRDAGGIHRPD